MADKSDKLLEAVTLITNLTGAAVALMSKAQQVGAMIAQAQKEGRDLNDNEMQELRDADDLAKAKLELAIKNAGQ